MKFQSGFALLSLLAVLVCSACGKQETSSTPAAEIKKQEPVSLFSRIPKNCTVIGGIDVKQIAQLEEIKKQIEENKSLPYYKDLQDAGLQVANISDIVFGIEPDLSEKGTNNTKAIVFVETKSDISLQKIIALIEKNNQIKLEQVKIQGLNGYTFTSTGKPDQTEQIILFQLNNKALGIVSKNMSDTALLGNAGGQSVMSNTDMMKLTNNAKQNCMFWIAGIIPDEMYKTAKSDTPKVRSGLISIDYANDILILTGTLYCADKDNVQKILQPLQMLSSIMAMNPGSGIKPEDISLKPDNERLDISIKLSKTALENLSKNQQQAQQQQDEQVSDTGSQLNLEAEGLSYTDTESEDQNHPQDSTQAGK